MTPAPAFGDADRRLPARRRGGRRPRGGGGVRLPGRDPPPLRPGPAWSDFPADGGHITDDTQMTLFTAEGLIRARRRSDARRIDYADDELWGAYRRWLATQGEGNDGVDDDEGGGLVEEPVLRHRRAPGTTCLSALIGNEPGFVDLPVNNSKGCGGVMRVAPVGLVARHPSGSGHRLGGPDPRPSQRLPGRRGGGLRHRPAPDRPGAAAGRPGGRWRRCRSGRATRRPPPPCAGPEPWPSRSRCRRRRRSRPSVRDGWRRKRWPSPSIAPSPGHVRGRGPGGGEPLRRLRLHRRHHREPAGGGRRALGRTRHLDDGAVGAGRGGAGGRGAFGLFRPFIRATSGPIESFTGAKHSTAQP